MNYIKNFKIKDLVLDSNVIFAPLAEYTDYPFRKLIRHFHKGLIFCEMIKMEALIRDKSSKILKYDANMNPIGAQLCGSNPNIVKDAARKIEDLGFDIIDLNCGCPVPKVVKDGSGAALLKDPNLIYILLSSIASVVKIPVSVKIRLGWDDDTIIAKEIVKIAEDAGCAMITIHGRTKKQGYSGKSSWEYIKDCKSCAKNILVFGNGDLYTPLDVDNIFKMTNSDGVMIARGFLSNLNISSDIENFFLKKDVKNGFEIKNVLLKYIDYLIEEKGIEKAVFDIRRISGWILRDQKNIKNLRILINSAKTIKEIQNHILEFDWIR